MEQKAGNLQLKRFEWSGFVRSGFFENALLSGLAGGLGLIIIEVEDVPNWLVYSIPLSAACFFLAFSRVWKSVREEYETGGLWDDCEDDSSSVDAMTDRFFEVPYLFSILALPFSAVMWQAFSICLLLFYVCDNFYNRSFFELVTEKEETGEPPALGDHDAAMKEEEAQQPPAPVVKVSITVLLRSLVAGLWSALWISRPDCKGRYPNSEQFGRYFLKRFRMNQFAIVVILLLAIPGWSFAIWGSDIGTVACGWIQTILLLSMESVVELHRNVGMPFVRADAEGEQVQ